MSSEFTASETTPLRTTSTLAAASDTIGSRSLSDTTNNVYTSHHHNNNQFDRERSPGEHHHLHQHLNRKMETNRQIFQKVVIDFVVLLCVGFPILFFCLFGEPYERGFFCGDESLMHPFHDSTVKNWMLYLVGLVLPIAIILVTEYVQANRHPKATNNNYKFLEWDIPPVVIQAYKQIGVFGFGAAISQLTVDIAKYSIGRLRPHFIDVCKPIFPDNTDCSDQKNLGIYHIKFKCTNPTSPPYMLKEMRLSFPSGHSSFSAFTMVYCAIYLHSRMTWSGSKLLKHFLQFILVMLAWGTALSRISDYKHHWSDALAGSLLGAVCALVVANYVSDLCVKKTNKSILPTTSPATATRHELVASLHSTNGRV